MIIGPGATRGQLPRLPPEPEPPGEPLPRATAFLFRGSLLFLTLGVFIVCCAYALARAARPDGMVLYFVGEFIVVLTPVLFLYLNRIVSHAAGLWMSISIGVATFVMTLCYSPLAFAFSDEYQHSYTVRSILRSGHLFHVNPTLPVSAQFPGMEIATAQLAKLSGLSIFASGSIIAGTSHVVLTGLVFLMAREFGLTARASAFAVIVFTTGYTYPSFLSYFAYETFAVVFLLATVVLFVKMLKSNDRRLMVLYGVGAVATGSVTTVTHHVTSFFMAGLVVLLAVCAASWSERWRHRLDLLVVVVAVLVAGIVVWDLAVATNTFHYLGQIKSLLYGTGTKGIITVKPGAAVVAQVFGGRSVPASLIPLPLRLLGDLGIAIVAVIIPVGAWRVWRDRATYPRYLWMTPLIASVGYYVLLPIFIFSPGGIGLVGRGQVLLLIPGSIIAAVALDRGFASLSLLGKHASRVRIRNASGSFIASVVVIGGVAASYPPYSGKLPAPYNVNAYTRSADARTIALGTWIAATIGPSARIVGGHTQMLLLESIAGVQIVPDAANLFETEKFTNDDALLVQDLQIGFVVADRRLTTEIPAGGSNFDNDPLSGYYARPLPAKVLTKFDHIDGVSRVFDDGVIVIYDLNGSRYYRPASGS